MSNIPDWIEELNKGDLIVVVFTYTAQTVYAEVLENNPRSITSMYFGTITVKYTTNNISKQEDLLYDDYSKEPKHHDSWYAYRVT